MTTATTTTAAKLTAGARILVDASPGPLSLAKVTDFVEVATLASDPEKSGRKLHISTDRGTFEVGGAAKVLLAPAVEASDPECSEDGHDHMTSSCLGPVEEPVEPPAPIIATVTTDTAGRLTHFSKLRIDRAGTVYERPVPWKVDEPEGARAPVRLTATLEDMGYRPRGLWQRDPNGKTWCEVLPLTPGEVVE